MIRAAATYLVAALAFLAVVTVFLPLKARAQSGAHGDGHAQQHDIYKNWSPPNNPGTSCCSAEKPDGSGDCRPTRAFVDEDGNWQAWNGRVWLVVPPDRILPPNYAGDGRSHLCEREQFIYCFSPAEPKS